jgi:hypothetical protein
MSNPAGWHVLASEAIDALPVEPVTLTPAQGACRHVRGKLCPETFLLLQVRGNSVILEVPLRTRVSQMTGTGSCRLRYKVSRMAVNVARIRFFEVTRMTWNFPCRSVPQQ